MPYYSAKPRSGLGIDSGNDVISAQAKCDTGLIISIMSTHSSMPDPETTQPPTEKFHEFVVMLEKDIDMDQHIEGMQTAATTYFTADAFQIKTMHPGPIMPYYSAIISEALATWIWKLEVEGNNAVIRESIAAMSLNAPMHLIY